MARYDPALMARLREAAAIIATDARARASRWSRRVPASVRMQGGSSSVTVVAGGAAAPQAYTMEGKKSGAPVSHPVFGHGSRDKWTWVAQAPRPFMREAVDAKAEEAFRAFAKVVDDWAKEKGFR
jgi:hypothetical protein